MDPVTLSVLGSSGTRMLAELPGIIAVLFPFLLCGWAIKLRHDRRLREGNVATLGAEERRALDEMSALAQRMEQRVENLERILDNELSGWRSRMPR